MAGLGYKSFSAGDVLTAAQVQGYLQDQAVMRFADSTARASAIGTANFTEGMISYLDNTNQVEYYSGSSWASIAPTTTQGLTLINTTSFSAVASQSVSDVFSATYDDYKVILKLTAAAADITSVTMRLRVSGADNSTANYSKFGRYQANDASTGASSSINQTGFVFGSFDTSTPNYFATEILFGNVFSTNYTTMNGLSIVTSSSGLHFSDYFNGYFSATTSFTGLTVIASNSTITGSISVYGMNK